MSEPTVSELDSLPVPEVRALAEGGEAKVAGSAWKLAAYVFVENRLAVAGLGVVVFMFLFCFVGPLLYHTDQINTDITQFTLPPSPAHPLGTDNVGYDVLGRLMVGGQTSLEIGVIAALLATTFGVLWGAIAGFVGGWLDQVMMRIVDSMLAIPTLFLLLVLAAMFVPSLPMLIFIVALVAWLVPARLIRGETLSLRTREYVDAVRVMGGGDVRIVLRHIIPNTIGTIMVNATFQVADAILTIAALSFLGLGVPPPATNWGGMLSNGVSYTFAGYWWLIYPAGLAIVITVVAFNLIGDAMRDAFEVRLQRR
ncbi:MAG: ABC transporter permease [Chloroflexi bacterium]|nr:MAG: ABC transporter permease [Chloroflexota bacterium]TMC74044.1 MAG: ABC transporter permease [Chloroflexota bacterium]